VIKVFLEKGGVEYCYIWKFYWKEISYI